MTYVMSDLHGCYGLYKKMLEKINFSDDDTLYVLGDVADRGAGPIDIYMDMMKRKNVVPLLGNHDQRVRALLSKYHFKSIQDCFEAEAEDEYMQTWVADRGITTILQYILLTEDEREKLLDYLMSFSPCDVVTAGGKTFFLSHTAPKKAAMADISKCTVYDFTWGDIEYDKQYFSDGYLVTGHTPTVLLGADKGRIYKNNGHIDVDCGAFFTGVLGCLCLDTMEEFYVGAEEGTKLHAA